LSVYLLDQLLFKNENYFMISRFISITGPTNVGKTGMLRRLYAHFINLKYEIVLEAESDLPENEGYGAPPGENESWDFYVLLKGPNGELVLIYSWGDILKNIQWLCWYLDELEGKGYKVKLILFALRDATDKLYPFAKNILQLNEANWLEIPLGRMIIGDTSEKAIFWYQNTVLNLIITYIIPQELNNN